MPELRTEVSRPIKKYKFEDGENGQKTEHELFLPIWIDQEKDDGENGEKTEDELLHIGIEQEKDPNWVIKGKLVKELSRSIKKCEFEDGENSKKTEDELVLIGIEQEKDPQWVIKGDFYYGGKYLPQKKLIGTYIDVISLLSNNGKTNYLVNCDGEFVSLDTVKGKNLVICCVSLPMTALSYHSIQCWLAMLRAYTWSSSSSDVNGFEMVVAVTVRRRKEKTKAIFDRFLSKLPCLAIPFPALDTRKSICSFIGFQESSPCHRLSAILVSPTGRILRYSNIPRFFYHYGFEWFTSTVKEIDAQDVVLRMRLDPFHKRIKWPNLSEAVKTDALLSQPLSLDKDILLCDSSRVLSTFCQAPGRSLTVSQLSNKYVGLYLCTNMGYIHELKQMHDECIANNQELEILLVFLPIYETPKSYYQQLFELSDFIKSWFILPYDNKVSRRLWRVFGQGRGVDRLIILPPNCQSGELTGRSVVQYYTRRGIPAYPFTRSSVLEQRLATLKTITAASLFKGTCETDTCLVQYGSESAMIVPQSAIKGKKLLLYFDTIDSDFLPAPDGGELFRLLEEHYPEIQAMGCEVVFVPLPTSAKHGLHVQMAKMPWPVMPVKAAKEAWDETFNLILWYDQFHWSYHNPVIALGEDGGILSLQVKKRLKKYGATDALFRDKLRNDLIKELNLLENADDEHV